MTAINIQDASGHSVSIEHDGADLTYLADKAMAIWKKTKNKKQPTGAGAAMGFSGDRRGAEDVNPPLGIEDPA